MIEGFQSRVFPSGTKTRPMRVVCFPEALTVDPWWCREDFLSDWTRRGLVYRPDLTASIAKDCYMCQLHYLRYNLLIFEVPFQAHLGITSLAGSMFLCFSLPSSVLFCWPQLCTQTFLRMNATGSELVLCFLCAFSPVCKQSPRATKWNKASPRLTASAVTMLASGLKPSN